jgi:hypothetical protein
VSLTEDFTYGLVENTVAVVGSCVFWKLCACKYRVGTVDIP